MNPTPANSGSSVCDFSSKTILSEISLSLLLGFKYHCFNICAKSVHVRICVHMKTTSIRLDSSRSPSTTIVSNNQNVSSPVNLFANLPGGLFPPNNTNNNHTAAAQGPLTSSVRTISSVFSIENILLCDILSALKWRMHSIISIR